MSKYRIYELAKEYNTTSKVIIDILQRHDIAAKNHMSSVDDNIKSVIDHTFAPKDKQVVAPSDKTSEPKIVPKQNVSLQSQSSQQSSGGQQQPNQQRPAGQQQSYQQRPAGQQQPNQQRPAGQQQPNQQRPAGQQQPYQQRPAGQQQSYQQRPAGQQQPYQQRPAGQQQPYQQRPAGQQQPYQQRPAGQQQPNQQRPAGQQQPYQQRPAGQQQSYQQRPAGQQQTNQQRPYSPRPTAQAAPTDSNRPSPGQRPAKPAEQKFSNSTQSRPTNKPGQYSNNRNAGKTTNRPGNTTNRPHGTRSSQKPMHSAKINQPIVPKTILLPESISIKEFSEKTGHEAGEIIKKLMLLGVMATINQEIDYDTATVLAEEFQITVEPLPPEQDPTEIIDIEDDPKNLQLRPPVVTVMGHVDHGKTSLLDCIRRTNVTAHEAGGITQHIGAYQVNYQGKKIVFLDTPGHEAFTAMRARGAQVTDIAILVVAADDGVMPQTIEAINHSKSAKVPIIVAINKIDRPNATPDRVKQQLAEYNLIPEAWGGDTIMVEVSAHQKTGISDLLEMILLVAEMQEFKANPNRHAQGTIIEAQLDKGRGPVATVLVQKGTLHIGDTIIAGTTYGKVRAMINDRGEKIKKALPSMPVEVLGLSDVPQAGDILYVTDERIARAVAEKRVAKKRVDEIEHSQKVSLEDLFKQIQQGNIKDLNIVVKADVQGSIEAIKQSLINIKNDEVKVNVVHAGVGAINESDVMLASAANALIIGFNVRPDSNAKKTADREKIDLRTYRVIYEALNDVEAAIKGMLAPQFKEVVQGKVEVRKVFTISKVAIAGCYVLEGKIANSSQIRVVRDGIVVHEGVLDSLRRFKDDVKEVATGYECGITLEKFRDLKENDILEAFTMEEIK